MFQEMVEAFQIFSKYSDKKYLLGAEHDILFVYVEPSRVLPEDIERLKILGFIPIFGSDEYGSNYFLMYI